MALFFERFRSFVSLSKPTGDLRELLLNYVEHDNTYRLLQRATAHLTADQKQDVTAVIRACETKVFPDTERQILRSTLCTTKQKIGETIAEFSLRIDDIASRGFDNDLLREEASFQAFLLGLRNPEIRRQLMMADVATFDGATQLAAKFGKIDQAVTETHTSLSDLYTEDVHRVHAEERYHPSNCAEHPQINRQQPPGNITNCCDRPSSGMSNYSDHSNCSNSHSIHATQHLFKVM